MAHPIRRPCAHPQDFLTCTWFGCVHVQYHCKCGALLTYSYSSGDLLDVREEDWAIVIPTALLTPETHHA